MIKFKVDGKFYTSEDATITAILEAHPELADDELIDFFDMHVEEFDDEELLDEEEE